MTLIEMVNADITKLQTAATNAPTKEAHTIYMEELGHQLDRLKYLTIEQTQYDYRIAATTQGCNHANQT